MLLARQGCGSSMDRGRPVRWRAARAPHRRTNGNEPMRWHGISGVAAIASRRAKSPRAFLPSLEHAVGARSGTRSRQSTCFQYAARGYDAQAFDEIVNMRVETSEMAARSRRNPAAKG